MSKTCWKKYDLNLLNHSLNELIASIKDKRLMNYAHNIVNNYLDNCLDKKKQYYILNNMLKTLQTLRINRIDNASYNAFYEIYLNLTSLYFS